MAKESPRPSQTDTQASIKAYRKLLETASATGWKSIEFEGFKAFKEPENKIDRFIIKHKWILLATILLLGIIVGNTMFKRYDISIMNLRKTIEIKSFKLGPVQLEVKNNGSKE